jgi:hypothetical protein
MGLFSVSINCETILATSILAVPELVLEDVEEIAINAYLKNAFLKTNCIIKKAIFMPALEALARFRLFDESGLKSDQSCEPTLKLLQRASA